MLENVKLFNQNTPIAELTGENIPLYEGCAFTYFKVKSAKLLNEMLVPALILARTKHSNSGREASLEDKLTYWLRKRELSGKREDITFEDINICWNDDRPHYASLTDQYWLQYDDEKWKDINFFTNEYSEAIGDAVFSKNLQNVKKLNFSYNSPDITTNGVMKKRWKREGKFNYLIKTSSKKFNQTFASEILAVRLLNSMGIGINAVAYELTIEGYELCCRCKNFVTKNTEFVPAVNIYAAVPYTEEELNIENLSERIYKHLITAVEHYNIDGAKTFIDRMIMIDRILMNTDRHLGNFGFLKNVQTGEFSGCAPLFDFGNSFYSDKDSLDKICFKYRDDELIRRNGNENIAFDKEQLEKLREVINESNLFKHKTALIGRIEKNNDEIIKKIRAVGNGGRSKGFPEQAMQMADTEF